MFEFDKFFSTMVCPWLQYHVHYIIKVHFDGASDPKQTLVFPVMKGLIKTQPNIKGFNDYLFKPIYIS